MGSRKTLKDRIVEDARRKYRGKPKKLAKLDAIADAKTRSIAREPIRTVKLRRRPHGKNYEKGAGSQGRYDEGVKRMLSRLRVAKSVAVDLPASLEGGAAAVLPSELSDGAGLR